MSQLISNDPYIGFAMQSSKGTIPASSTAFVKYLEETFQPEQELSYLREGGDDELVATVVKNLHRERWGFKVNARPNIVAYLFAYFLGEDTKSGGADPYTHVLTRSAGNRSWLTLRRKLDTNVVQKITDAKIEKLTVEGEAGQPVSLTVEGSGLTAAIEGSEESPTYESDEIFMFYDGNGAFSVEGSVNQRIKKFTIEFIINSQDGLQTDDILLEDLPDLSIDVNITLEFYPEDTGFWKKALYNNQTSPQEDVYTGTLSIDLTYVNAASKNRQFKIEIGKMSWEALTGVNAKGEPEAIVEALAGVAMKPAAGEMITVTCQNELSADLVDQGS